VMACAVKMLDVGGIGAGNPQLGSLTLPHGVGFEQIKLQMEALPPVEYESLYLINAYRPAFASNSPSAVIHAFVQPTKVFRVSKSPTFARG
jgi:hypothetical protein